MLQLLEETGNGRDINRHFYTVEEAKEALDKPVVKALLDLCRFRNLHPAFNGEASFPSQFACCLLWKLPHFSGLACVCGEPLRIRIVAMGPGTI